MKRESDPFVEIVLVAELGSLQFCVHLLRWYVQLVQKSTEELWSAGGSIMLLDIMLAEITVFGPGG